MTKKNPISVDIDGYLQPLLEAESMATMTQILQDAVAGSILDQEVFQLYYLAARSSVQFVGEYSQDSAEALAMWRQVALGAAGQLTKLHRRAGRPVEPPWLNDNRRRILSVLQEDYPEAKDIEISLTLDPRISARAKGNNSVVVSVFSREILRTFNTVIYEEVLSEVEAQSSDMGGERSQANIRDAMIRKIDVSSAIRCMLPYWIFCNDFIHVGNIPIMGVSSLRVLEWSALTARNQMIFIMLHEFAHILLGHCKSKGVSPETRVKFESDADRFALGYLKKVLLSDGMGDEDANLEAWISVRWLFRYQFLDYRVGQLLRDSDSSVLMLEHRRSEILSHARGYYSAGNFIAERGVSVLMQIEGKLIEKGHEFVRSVADQLFQSMARYVSESKVDKGPNLQNPEWFEPWWEKI